jgi:hypothetical protein
MRGTWLFEQPNDWFQGKRKVDDPDLKSDHPKARI